MNHYIYQITNLLNDKKYIGKRSCRCSIEKDKYMGSGIYLKRAINKYGIENFEKRILEICYEEKELNEKEKYWIKYYDAVNNKNYYNIALGGDGGNVRAGFNEERIKQWKNNMSKSHKGKKGHPAWNNGLRIKPPTVVRQANINEFVWRDWQEFIKDLTFNKGDLISMALKEFMENHS